MSDPTAPSSLASVVTTVSMGGGWASCSIEMVAPASGTARWIAVATPHQKAPDSLSVGSRDTHAVTRSSEADAASQSASNVVLPKPGGAEMSVTFARIARLQQRRQPGPGHQGLARTRDVELRIGEDAGHASG